MNIRRSETAPGRWEDVEVQPYKREDDAPFKEITRQRLFADSGLGSELRYFEIAPGGHSTLERHQHTHAVMILRGRGSCLVGDRILELKLHDLITVPPLTWHQFRSANDEPLGFLCMVSTERDRPMLPTAEELKALRTHKEIAEFIRA